MLGRGIDWVPADQKEIEGTRICVKIAVFIFPAGGSGWTYLVSDENAEKTCYDWMRKLAGCFFLAKRRLM